MYKREAAVFTAYTGILFGKIEWFHEYVQELLERPVWTHEFAEEEIWKELKEKSKPDFLRINIEAIEEWE